jgi:hypothetical protein
VIARRRRLVFAQNSLRLGGSQTVLLELVPIAIKAGYEVVVASRGGELERSVTELGARTVRLITREGVAGRRLTHPVDSFKTLASIAAFTQLVALFRQPGTIVQTSQPWPTAIGAAAALATRSPLVWLAHGTTPVELPPAFPRVVRRASHVWVGISAEVTGALGALAAAGQRVVHIPNPLPMDPPESELARNTAGVIGIVSTMTANKRTFVASCLESIADLTDAGTPRVVRVIGDGPDLPALRRLAASLQLRNPRLAVEFLGSTPRPWVALADCELVIGMGMVALEGAIRGHNVVCASSDGVGGQLTTPSYSRLAPTNFTGRRLDALSRQVLTMSIGAALQDGLDPTLPDTVREAHGSGAARLWTDLWARLGT